MENDCVSIKCFSFLSNLFHNFQTEAELFQKISCLSTFHVNHVLFNPYTYGVLEIFKSVPDLYSVRNISTFSSIFAVVFKNM